MKCERIQEWLLTDYLDNNLEEDRRKEVETHLQGCRECRQLLADARKASVIPFAMPGKNPVSQARVWDQIKARLHEEQTREESRPVKINLWQRFIQGFAFPRPAFVFGTMMVVIILALVLIRLEPGKEPQVADSQEPQPEYVTYLLTDSDDDIAYGMDSQATEMDAYYL